MTDAQQALAQVREALKAGPTRGNWVVAPKMTMPSIVCAVNNVEVCPADHRDPSHQDVDAAYIAAANPANIAALLDRLDKAERENERLRAERDEHARWREKLADDLHERESQIIDGWAALRDSGVQSEKNIADGIKLLRAENEALAADARRYRWLRGDACPDHSVRWTQWEVRCWVAPFWSGDLRREGLDRSIDAARAAEQSERRGK